MAKNFFKREFQFDMLKLEHDSTADFYLSCWQSNKSSLPLLILRVFAFLGSVAIVISSFVIMSSLGTGRWFIYLTHWGLLLILFTSGFGVIVSAKIFFKGRIDGEFALPWYIKWYWLMFNISVPMALVISVFYWALLRNNDDFAPSGAADYVNDTLDVFIHLVNSILMMLLFMTCRHPFRILHIYQPILFALVYVLFSVVYHVAGGSDYFGNRWIYPMIDWSEPGQSILVSALTTIFMIVIYILLVALAAGRDALAKTRTNNSKLMDLQNF